MPGSRASVFGEPEDFEEALRADGVAALLVTGRGRFRARLTQILLERLHLASAEEELARVAVVVVPANTILVSWPIGDGPVSNSRSGRAGGVGRRSAPLHSRQVRGSAAG